MDEIQVTLISVEDLETDIGGSALIESVDATPLAVRLNPTVGFERLIETVGRPSYDIMAVRKCPFGDDVPCSHC